MRSWVFRNRRRLDALLGRPPGPGPAPRAEEPGSAGAPAPLSRTPRVVVLQPARRAPR